MQILTTRFGVVTVDSSDVITFPEGMLGLEDCRRWVLLADTEDPALAWLQSVSRPEVALAVVSPRRFVPSYQLRVSRQELAPLQLSDPYHAQVLAVVGKSDNLLTLNLKAPLAFNLELRLGRQVMANGEEAVQHVLSGVDSRWREVA